MANITIIGAGMCGLLSGTLLARAGHHVTVLERDPAEPLDSAEAAWEKWERRGVGQFRLLHYLQPRFRQEAERELPELLAEMDALGAIRYGLDRNPVRFTGGPRAGDEAFVSVTGRRPVIETAVARLAESTGRLTIRRGAAVAGLTTGPSSAPGIPHVRGVRLESGEEIDADLVVDAGGRRSGIDRLLEDAGARPTAIEQEDLGLVYYGRHFSCPNGAVPDLEGPILSALGTISTLTLPADNGTCGLGLLALGSDKALRKLKDPAAWERVWRSVPHVAHWIEGSSPIDEGVAVMANVPDRIRSYVIDGAPVATGVTSVADAWSCTNPSVGRGITIGLLHALCLRDTIASNELDDPLSFALAFDAASVSDVEPWYRATVDLDRARLHEMQSLIDEAPVSDEDDPQAAIRKAFFNGAFHDPDLLRALSSVGSMLATPQEAMGRPGIFEKVLAQADAEPPVSGPTRAELVELVA